MTQMEWCDFCRDYAAETGGPIVNAIMGQLKRHLHTTAYMDQADNLLSVRLLAHYGKPDCDVMVELFNTARPDDDRFKIVIPPRFMVVAWERTNTQPDDWTPVYHGWFQHISEAAGEFHRQYLWMDIPRRPPTPLLPEAPPAAQPHPLLKIVAELVALCQSGNPEQAAHQLGSFKSAAAGWIATHVALRLGNAESRDAWTDALIAYDDGRRR